MKLKNIEIRKIHSHPDNPRKDLGDINELAESIRANGVMQNLTVVERADGEYTVIIGHRRLAASLKAGLDVVPCAVVKMDEKEQQSTMLVENMQRSDLTVYEQAQGFQMMLDLGSTEDEIAEKTGFSKQTVKHRINLAKLDPDILKEKNADENFQMTLKDMYELEKIDDVEARNEILSTSGNSMVLKAKVSRYLEDQKKQQKRKIFYEKLKELSPDIKEQRDTTGYQYLTSIYISATDTDAEVEEKAKRILNRINEYNAKEVIFTESFDSVYIYKKMEKKEETPESKKKNDLKEKQKEIINKLDNRGKSIVKEITQFVEDIILNKHKLSRHAVEERIFILHLWDLIIHLDDSDTDLENMAHNLGAIYKYRHVPDKEELELDELQKEVDKMNIINQMWLTTVKEIEFLKPYRNWNGEYEKDEAKLILQVCDCISVYGYYLKEEDEKFLNNESELKTRLEEIEKEIKKLNG